MVFIIIMESFKKLSNLLLHSVEFKYAYFWTYSFVWMISIWEIQTTIPGRTKHLFSLALEQAGIYKSNGVVYILPCGGVRIRDMAQKRLVCNDGTEVHTRILQYNFRF